MKKIAIIYFKLGMVGGVLTWILHLVDAIKKLGHYVDLINIVDGNSNPAILPEMKKIVGESGHWNLVQTKLSIHLEQLGKTIDILNKFDLLIFIHPCPHPVKGYETKRNWQALYTQTKTKKAVIFHDPTWKKMYPWIKDVIHCCDFVFGGQPIFTESLKDLVGDRAIGLHHPLNLDGAGFYKERKKRRLLWLSQWRGWKGIRVLFPELPKIDAEIKLFNSGMFYYILKKKPIWEQVVKNNVKYCGLIEPEQIEEELKEAMGVIDLSGFKGGSYKTGVFNYVGLEAMKNGAIVLAAPNMVSQLSPLTEKEVYVVDMNNIAGSINKLLDSPMTIQATTENAMDYLKINHDHIKEVEKMLSICFSKTYGNTKHRENRSEQS